MNPTHPPPNPSETPEAESIADQIRQSLIESGLMVFDEERELIAEPIRTIERRATLAERRCGELEAKQGEGDAYLLWGVVREFLISKSIARTQVLLGRMAKLITLHDAALSPKGPTE